MNIGNFSKPKNRNILWMITLLALVIWGLLFLAIKQGHQTNIDTLLNAHTENQETNWMAVQKVFKGNVELCFETFIKTPKITSLLQQAQVPETQKQARIALYRALYSHYQQRLKYTDSRFNMSIHDAENRVFLRFAQPTLFGDDLTQTRSIITLAQQTLKPVHAFDNDGIIASYIHIMPVIHQGQYLGSVEYSRPFYSMEKAIKNFSPATEFGIIYQKDYVEKTQLKTFDSLYKSSQFSNTWVDEDPDSLLETSPPIHSAVYQGIAHLAKRDPLFQQKLAANTSFADYYQFQNQYYSVALTAIQDVNKQTFAYLISLAPSNEIAVLKADYVNSLMIMSVIVLLGSLLFYKIVCSYRNHRTQSRYLQSVHNTMSEGVYVTDMQGKITMINSAALNLLGYHEKEVIGQNAHHLFHKTQANQKVAYCPLEEVYQKNQSFKGEILFITTQNGLIWADVSSEALIIEDKPVGAVIVFSDITEQKHKDDDLRISATAFETQNGIMITDSDGIILRVNKSFTRICGYEAEDAIGQTPKLLNSGRQSESFYQDMWNHLKEKHFWQGEIWNKHKNGNVFLEWLTITAVLDSHSRVTHYVANFSDITERQLNQDKIEKLAFYDALTNLPNRRLLKERLDQAVRYTKRTNQCGALFFLDLDNFKTLNDSKGHMVGDILLQQVAERLKKTVREVDTIARLGGDEFVILLENLGECKVDAIHQSEKVALTVLEAFNAPFILEEYSHHSSPSIGVEIVHPNNNGADAILAHADLAMYQAKKQGRNTVRFFNPKMQIDIEEMAELQSELRQALANNDLELYYQPQVDQYTHIIGAEALIRWHHSTRGFISPAEFIPMAEKSGLIIPLGDFVILTACQTLVNWSNQPAMQHIKLSVNVSAKQFAEPNFATKVKNVLSVTAANPNNLKLELTESLVVADVENTIKTMNELRDIGIRFSMDDFGTGHSSLSYIKRLPLSQLKIDQSFVRDLNTDADDAAIVKTIIAMSNTLNLEVVAEGVETAEQKAFLKDNQCYIYQGYLFSRPLPLDGFENLVNTTHEINDFDFDIIED